MNKALGITFKLCQMLLYSVGSVRDTININKKTNGVYRRIDLGLCKVVWKKTPKAPCFITFFHTVQCTQGSKVFCTYICLELNIFTDFSEVV